jgi:hypothetical protein
MIELLVTYGVEAEERLLAEIDAHVGGVRASAGGGDRQQVGEVEAAVRADPRGTIVFDADGTAILAAAGRTYHAGLFEVASIGTLRARALARKDTDREVRSRLWVLDGASPATDIGSLQATASVGGPGMLFQVASQFNCLEAPGPYVTPVARYFEDPTQGPRASISAFPGTVLRHYAAPGPDGERFVQVTDGAQINLLEAVCSADVGAVRNGYLMASAIADLEAFAAALVGRFDAITVGVHDDVQVVLGYDWDGRVEDSLHRRIGQVFTSTLACGAHGREVYAPGSPLRAVCATLLRAAYLGTLLAAATLDRPRVVLTLIGGGVFGNPVELIWDSLLWALDEVDRYSPCPLDVVVNGRNLGSHVDRDALAAAVRARRGVLVAFQPGGETTVHG